MKKFKTVKAWTVYSKPEDKVWLGEHILTGKYARGILRERVAKFFRPEDYEVLLVEIRIPLKSKRKL